MTRPLREVTYDEEEDEGPLFFSSHLKNLEKRWGLVPKLRTPVKGERTSGVID